jgi:2-(1,2-epoxy-1,2-dihydrophenyl)acetyl-CoA isomerase
MLEKETIMNPDRLVLEQIQDKIHHIILNRAHKKNALVEPMREYLAQAIENIKSDHTAKLCVITGAGNAFCAGGDLNAMNSLVSENKIDQIETYMDWMIRAVVGIKELKIPIVALINGPAIGSGMNISLACDIKIATQSAVFGQPYVNIGLYPDWGGTYSLPRCVGNSKALELFMSGRLIDSNEAFRLGIVDYLYPDSEFQKKSQELLNTMVNKPSRLLKSLKSNITKESISDLKTKLLEEKRIFIECVKTPYFKEIINKITRKKHA